METSDQAAYRRARGAYERGRWRRGLIHALPMLALALVALIGSHPPLVTLVTAGLAVVVVTMLDHRGGALGAGARLGVIASIVPFAASMAARSLPHLEVAGACFHGCVLVCAAACIATMAALAYMTRQRSESRGFWLAATAVAVGGGAIACACVDVTGIVLVVAAVATASVPIMVFEPLRQT